jgi:hypothetical protein
VSGRAGIALVVGLIVGGAGGYISAASQVTSAKAETKEARGYQSEFATENSKLSSENRLLEERMKKMENNSYDRQAITSCMMVSSILSSAVSAHLTGQELSSIEKGTMMQYMSSAIVASHGKSRQAAMIDLLDERQKIDNECLDRARIKADPLAPSVK